MLEIRNLSFSVEEDGNRKEILRNLNLQIKDGKFVVITGPNGSGKSTLARLIMGIEKPSAGQILLDGTDITGLDITGRAQAGISFAFQQPVRFKGIRVQDLLRLASGRNLSVSQACEYFQNLIRIFEKMRSEIKDSAIVIISHQERILQIADEILLLSGGEITRRGSPDEILPGLVTGSGVCVRLQS